MFPHLPSLIHRSIKNMRPRRVLWTCMQNPLSNISTCIENQTALVCWPALHKKTSQCNVQSTPRQQHRYSKPWGMKTQCSAPKTCNVCSSTPEDGAHGLSSHGATDWRSLAAAVCARSLDQWSPRGQYKHWKAACSTHHLEKKTYNSIVEGRKPWKHSRVDKMNTIQMHPTPKKT